MKSIKKQSMKSIKKQSMKSIKKKSIKKQSTKSIKKQSTKSIKKIKGGSFDVKTFDVKTNCIRKYRDYVVHGDTYHYTIDTNLVVNREINDKSIGISFYSNNKNVIFNLNRFDYVNKVMYTDAVNNNIKKFPYSAKAETLIQKLNEFKPTKIILFGLTEIILTNFLVLLEPCILYPNKTICLYKLTNYNNEILVGADKGNIIAIKDVNRLNLRPINVDSILENSQFSPENYDVVDNATGFYTESTKILVDNGFATCIGICATVDNKNYMSHISPYDYKNMDNLTINSWIKLINDKKITKLIIFGQDESILITFSDKLQQLLKPLDINLYVLRDYNAWNNTTFIGINKNELIMFKKQNELIKS